MKYAEPSIPVTIENNNNSLNEAANQTSSESPLDVFNSLSTGNASLEQHLHLMQQVARIPNFLRDIDNRTDLWHENSYEGEIRSDRIATMALDHSGLAFVNGRDALCTIYAVVGKADVLPSTSLATLARQALESGLVSRWILGDMQIETLRKHGYAAAWKDFQRRIQFVKSAVASGSISQENLSNWKSKLADTKSDLLKLGAASKLMKSGKNNDLRPKQILPNFTELTRSVETPMGTLDIGWLYSVLSGLAHGTAWAILSATQLEVVLDHLKTDSAGKRVSAGHSYTKINPLTNTAAMAISIAMHQLQSVYDLQVNMRKMTFS